MHPKFHAGNGAEQPDRGGQTSPSDTGLISSAACPEAAGTDIAGHGHPDK